MAFRRLLPRFFAHLLLTSATLCAFSAVDEPAFGRSPGDAVRGQRYCVDRVVLRFDVPELGGTQHPRYIFARELAFEARLEALSERSETGETNVDFNDSHVRIALQRHIAEEILVHLPMSPPPTADEISRRAAEAYMTLEQRVGGRQALLDAAYAEGIEMNDINALVRRRAMAGLYLDTMVSPMLDPSDAQLQQVLVKQPNPFRGRPFQEVSGALRRWYVSVQVERALFSFFRSARQRIHIVRVNGGC